MERKTQEFQSISELQDQAKSMMREGYTVLVAQAQCGHWIGYSAFRKDPKTGEEDAHLLVFSNGVSLGGVDPRAIYAQPN